MFFENARKISFFTVLGSMLFFAVIVLFSYYEVTISAAGVSWEEGTPQVKEIVKSNRDDQIWCQWQKTDVSNQNPKDICISHGKNVRLGYDGGLNYYISIGYDTKMYPLSTNGNSPILIPGTNTLITKVTLNSSGAQGLTVTKNIIDSIQSEDFPNRQYSLDQNIYSYSLRNESNDSISINGIGYSENGAWIIAQNSSIGWLRINTSTGQKTKININYRYNPSDYMYGTISDDGKYLAVLTHSGKNKIHTITDVCSSTNEEMPDSSCSFIDIPSLPVDTSQNPSVYPSTLSFTDHGNELRVYYWSNDETLYTGYSVYPGSFIITPRLDYLALGDSYSSGEGDTALNPQTNGKYYRGWTDVERTLYMPREKCHLSTRSYPYRLAHNMGLGAAKDSSTTRWQSVACSGAQTYDITDKNSDEYDGQGEGAGMLWSSGGYPRLSDFTNKNEFKIQALNEFIPGRQKQIEFVKKYKPKVVTLTIGGNDVDFGSILGNCASSPRSCDTATEVGRRKLGSNIKSQYKKLVSLYGDIKKASPGVKVYVLGYSQIILDSQGMVCPANTAGLDIAERKVMVAGYWYINQVIKTAAAKAGVMYVDTESALNGHRLCESDKVYANGVSVRGGSERQESFHPNADGNAAIADSVWRAVDGQSLLDYSHYPSAPDNSISERDIPDSDYLQTASSAVGNSENKNLMNGFVKRGQTQRISADELSFKPNSTIQVTLHSDPVDLGSFIATEEGSFDQDVIIPDTVAYGYHTLRASGETYSGEPIEYDQTILVVSNNPSDLDGNSIEDTQESCGPFVIIAGIDKDYDKIDDACDSEILIIQAYRVRNGDSSKGENASYLYLERNIGASQATGISGDYDPDNDGWAIVAQSTKLTDSGTPAHFWIDDSKVPHVSIRTDSKGCVQFRPRTLKVVEGSKTRKLKQEAKNTNTCRFQLPGDDVDKDNVRDNQQLLYRARNGSLQVGEDPNRLYLERSAVAAEAQLGVSDYSYSKAWNLLAMNQSGTAKLQFVKIVIVRDKIPTIIAKKIESNKKRKPTIVCIAYQPPNINVITVHNVTKKLKKVNLPEGENCEK